MINTATPAASSAIVLWLWCLAMAVLAAAQTPDATPPPTPTPTPTPPSGQEKIQQLYRAIITPDSVDENTVLYGVPTTLATLNGDRMFVLNLSFVSSNVTDAKLHFYHKPLSPSLTQAQTRSVRLRMAVYNVGRNGNLRHAQYVSMANLTQLQPGWSHADLTDVINRLLRTVWRRGRGRERERGSGQLSIALQFEQEQRGKMHQVAPNKFMQRRSTPYVIISSASSDTSNFYNWFEAVLKSGLAPNPNNNPGGDSPPEYAWEGVDEQLQVAFNASDQADSPAPFVNLFGLPPFGPPMAERVCSVRPWTVAVPRFLRKYIIHPAVLPLNRCAGACLPGVSPEDFRNSLIGRTYFDQTRRSRLHKTCVPDKLGPLEMVFLSTKDAQYVVSRVSIPNLVAESCKCIYSYV